MINKILIRKSDRKTLHKDRRSLGMNGENLQEVLLFCLDEKIEGAGIVEVELPNGEKGMIEVECTEEGYELPIKSSLMAQTGFVKFQLRILHDNEEIFKSEIIPLEVKDSINATATIPEEYPSWVDTLTNLKKDLEKAESERVSNEEERQTAEEARQENFTEMQKTVENATSNIKDLKEDYNTNAKKKTDEFNNNFEEKQKAINDNAEAKTTAFGENAEAQTKTFNTNSDDKLAEYNRNHTAKMKEFDDNYDTKTKTFDDNAADKLDEYNKNTELKEKSFNDNAGTKTETFNSNAADKQNEFDENASDKLSEYNQNAKELINKVEQVQAENETLKAENKLIKEQIPSASASGNSVHIEDSGTLDFDWKIKGRHKQATREGYNLFQIHFVSKTVGGVTVVTNEDKSIVANGTMTAAWLNFIQYDITDKLEDSETYTIWQKNYATGLGGIYLQIRQTEIENPTKFVDYYSASKKVTFTVDKSKYKYTANLQTAGKTETFNNYTNAYMLYKGTEDKPYEQYGVSPSPDYQSEVETVGNIVNEFNCRDTYTSKGITLTKYIDGSFKVEGTATENFNFNIANYFKLKGTHAFKYEVLEGNSPEVWFWNSTDSNSNLTFSKTNNSTVATFEDEKELTLNFEAVKGTTYSFTARMKIVKGKETGLYSPYGMGSVEMDVVNKNFLNIANTEETTKGGITYSVKNGILKLNGTATAGFDIQLSKNIKIKKGKYIHSSNYIQSGLYISFDNLGYTVISATVGKKKKIEITEDTIYKRYFIWIDKGTVLNNIEIKLQLEVGDTATDIVEHQSQTAIMPIQQEMLEGDYVKDVEHHEWEKVVLDGTEKLALSGATTDEIFVVALNISGAKDGYGCSNYFVYSSTIKQNSIAVYNNGKNLRFCVNKNEFLNLEAFKALLKSKYDEGNPVIVYYKLATPINLELTEEQKAVRQQKLYTYKNITNISLSDELASVEVEYKKDQDTINKNYENRLAALEAASIS
jgi:hypothetical protein